MNRFLILLGLLLFCTPVMAQPSAEMTAASVGSLGTATFKQDTYVLDGKHVQQNTENFNFTGYSDYASAMSSHCQVFKEQGRDFWWANCGRPINGFAVVSNMSQE